MKVWHNIEMKDNIHNVNLEGRSIEKTPERQYLKDIEKKELWACNVMNAKEQSF